MESKGLLLITAFLVTCGCMSFFLFAGQQSFAIRASVQQDSETWLAFQQWMIKQNKIYNGIDEMQQKYTVFHNNYMFIQSENSKGYSHKLAINKFADMTKEEFKAKYLTLKPKANLKKNIVEDSTDNLPDSIDWTNKGPVTPVKDQGQCGSCWAFSTTGGLEAAYYFKYGKLISFSEQQLVDCSGDQGNYGCDGGLQEYAYDYLQSNGAELESDYPYTAQDDSCSYDGSKEVTTVSSYVNTPTNELALKASVAVRPTPVSVDAETWQFYGGGVYSEDCGTDLDHAVLAVGYDTDESGTMYWKIKNSWNTDWGEDGFIRLLRTDSSSEQGQCAVAADPLYPVL